MRIFVALIVLATLAGEVHAQDAQFWTNHYGTRAELLGGAVVGGIRDLSSTYYNPGAMPLTKDMKLAIATDAFQVSNIHLENGAGDDIDLSSWQGGVAPSMIAIRITGDWLGSNILAISSVNRYSFDFEVSGRSLTPRDAINPPAGPDAFAAERLDATRLSEQWFGVSWARRNRDWLGFGISQYIAYRSQRGRTQITGQAVTPDGSDGSSAIAYDEFKSWNIRALWKLGVALDFDPVRLGVTMTTPSVGIYGSGASYVNVGTTNAPLAGDTAATNFLAADYADGLNAHYESPFSVATGISYLFENTSLNLTVEWFKQQDTYVVMDAGEFQSQTTGETFQNNVTNEMNSVFNWGVGVAHRINPGLEFYGAFFTDRSAYISAQKSQIATSSWDIFHGTVGSVFNFAGVDITTGLSYGHGRDTGERELNLEDPTGDILDSTRQKIQYDRLKFIIGISVPYGNSAETDG